MASRRTSGVRGRPKNAPPPEERRSQLLDAAAALIKRDGPLASMDAIAAEAGVTKPILYSHFGDKAGLCSALAERVGERLAHDIGLALDVTVDPRRQVHDAVAAFVSWVREEPELRQFLTISGSNATTDIRRITNRVADVVAPSLRLLADVTNSDPSPSELFAHGVVGFAYMAVDWWAEDPVAAVPDADERIVNEIADFIWSGLTGREPDREPSG